MFNYHWKIHHYKHILNNIMFCPLESTHNARISTKKKRGLELITWGNATASNGGVLRGQWECDCKWRRKDEGCMDADSDDVRGMAAVWW